MSSAYSTGFSNNGGLAVLGNPDAVDAVQNIDKIVLSKPNAPWRIVTNGAWPTDTSDARTATNVAVTVYEGALPLFSADAAMSIQGQSSATQNKKGYKFKFTNPTTGNKLQIKIGDWLPSNKWDVKGYAVDRTLVRDTVSAALWRAIRRTGEFPNNLIAPLSAWQYWDDTDLDTHSSALFSTEGFPVELWNGNTFSHLGVWRTGADIDDFLMDDANRSHISMQPQHAGNMWDHAFTGTDWSISSPKIKKYDDQMDISKAAPDVQAAGTRIMQWCLDVRAGKIDMRATYPFYIDLPSWLDYILFCEVAGNGDGPQNNFNMVTWDNMRWHICAYDMDESWGIAFNTTPETAAPDKMGFIMNKDTHSLWAGSNFFQLFYTNFLPELRARWAELRRSGTISYAAVASLVKEQIDMLDPAMMAQDLANFPPYQADVINFGTQGRCSYTYLLDWAKGRIAWIDAQWGYSE
ncbi:MAG: CotH protein [Caudoviricetes sp.]|nr:MAG: CotH protein [Caudoviricetes sp.]